ncbi:MAG: hypothetical protein ABIK89_04760 [Planctomycetota bacterium]
MGATAADIHERLAALRAASDAELRRLILERGRVDLLCTEVLGYEVRSHHLRMVQHAARYRDGNLILGFRGSGKTSVATIAFIVHDLLCNPDKRILLVSKSMANAAKMLGEVKKHLEAPRTTELFGEQVGRKWDEFEIIVAARKSRAKEPSVTVAGWESSVASQHYDAIYADDLLDEELARSKASRARLHTFWHRTMIPMLEPDGDLHVRGNTYHPLDLYAHLQEGDLSGPRCLRVPAWEGNDVDGYTATWPERYTVAWLRNRRNTMGTINFQLMYECSATAMAGGGYFEADDCQRVPASGIPHDLPAYIGADLAIGRKAQSDLVEIVGIRYDRHTDRFWVCDYAVGRWRFVEQRRIITEIARRLGAARAGIEAQQFQVALAEEAQRKAADLVFVPVYQKDSKEIRAARMQAKFQAGRAFFGPGTDALIEELVLFPTGPHDHGVDALEIALRVARMGKRKERPEFGLIGASR